MPDLAKVRRELKQAYNLSIECEKGLVPRLASRCRAANRYNSFGWNQVGGDDNNKQTAYFDK